MWNKVIEETFKQKIINFLGEKYGKVNNRSASHGKSSRTQTRHIISKSRSNKGRAGESKARIVSGKKTEVIRGL